MKAVSRLRAVAADFLSEDLPNGAQLWEEVSRGTVVVDFSNPGYDTSFLNQALEIKRLVSSECSWAELHLEGKPAPVVVSLKRIASKLGLIATSEYNKDTKNNARWFLQDALKAIQIIEAKK